MFCPKCGHQNNDAANFCAKCGAGFTSHDSNASAPVVPTHSGVSISKPESVTPHVTEAVEVLGIPEGIKGWSWGAFLLNWVWAIGNKTWVGLLALTPYVGIVVAIWLGIKGREMAWKNKRWDSVEHFNRVQKKWSLWAVAITLVSLVIGIAAAIAIPAYKSYVDRSVDVAEPAPIAASIASDTSATPSPQESTPSQPISPKNGAITLDSGNLSFPLNTPLGKLTKTEGVDGQATISVNQQILFSGDDARWQSPVHVFKTADQREFISMQSSGGRGTSCESLFFFLIVDTAGIKYTPEFGTCSSQGTVAESNGSIVFQIAKMGGYSHVVFDGNAATEEGKVVVLAESNDPSK